MKALKKLLGISALVVLLSTICAAEINVTYPDNTSAVEEETMDVTSTAPITSVNLYYADVEHAMIHAGWFPSSDRTGTIDVLIKMAPGHFRRENIRYGSARLVYEITNSAGEYTSGSVYFLTECPY